MPERVSPWSVYRLFETADGEQIFIGLIREKHWARFCSAFGRWDLKDDPRLATNRGRIREWAWLLPEIAGMIKRLTRKQVVENCEAAGVCYAPIARPEDLFDDPQLNQPDHGLLETAFPSGQPVKLPRLPIQMGTFDFGKRVDPPARIGQDTRRLLVSLGVDEKAIDRLAEQGVIVDGSL